MVSPKIEFRGLDQLRRKLSHFDADLGEELIQASQRVGAQLSVASKRLLQKEVYAVPIPLTVAAERTLKASSPIRKQARKGRHGRWRRKGTLQQSETYALDRVSRGAQVRLVNNARHAAARAALGGPNPPNRANRRAGIQIPDDENPSKTRPVGDWHARVVKEKRGLIRAEYRDAVIRALRSRT